MKRRPHTTRHRGFMTLVAVLLMGLLTAALALLVAATMADVRRTRSVTTDAQFRQLLLAGGADVTARSASWTAAPTVAWLVQLPPDLADYTVRAVPQSNPAGDVDVTVKVAGQGHQTSQRMTWTRSAAGWRLTDVAMTGK